MKILHLQHVLFFYRLYVGVVVTLLVSGMGGLLFKIIGSALPGIKAKAVYIGILAGMAIFAAWGTYLLIVLRG